MTVSQAAVGNQPVKKRGRLIPLFAEEKNVLLGLIQGVHDFCRKKALETPGCKPFGLQEYELISLQILSNCKREIPIAHNRYDTECNKSPTLAVSSSLELFTLFMSFHSFISSKVCQSLLKLIVETELPQARDRYKN